MAEKENATKKAKRPSALKRHMQSEKRRLKNKTFKSKIATSIKALEKSIKTAEDAGKLEQVYSLADKGVKKGIFKANKAARIKSRMTKKVSKAKA
jgi:small subunit ribosomal protein S20